jgi:hypothetical protein
MRFFRHDGIYRSDVSSLLFTPGACPAFRSGRCQGIEHAGKNAPSPSSAMSSGRLFLDRVGPPEPPSRPGEFRPEPLTDPDLSLSTHPARATLRKLPPSVEISRFLLLPVDQMIPTRVTHPLPSTDITPSHRYYEAVRP